MPEMLHPFVDDARHGSPVVMIPRGSTRPDFAVETTDGAPRHFDLTARGHELYDDALAAAEAAAAR